MTRILVAIVALVFASVCADAVFTLSADTFERTIGLCAIVAAGVVMVVTAMALVLEAPNKRGTKH